VRLVVAHVVSTLLQVVRLVLSPARPLRADLTRTRQENALPWLRLALEGVNGAHDATLKLSSLGMLVSNAQRVKEAGVAGFSVRISSRQRCVLH
jgi:hypothetical protein